MNSNPRINQQVGGVNPPKSTPSLPPSTHQTRPLILPDISPHQGSSKDVTGAKSFVTQTWTIPDRPKPGRKPKQKTHPESSQQANQADRANGSSLDNSSLDSSNLTKTKASSILLLQPEGKTKDSEINTSPETIQQAYINSLEGKVESLQSLQSEQVNYYKTLASQSSSKANKLQSENDLLQSQIKILRLEVIRLRKRISQLVKKPSTTELHPTTIVVEDDCPTKQSRVRKQESNLESPPGNNFLDSSGNSIKKPRHQSDDSEAIEQPKAQTLSTIGKVHQSPKPTPEIYLIEGPHHPTEGTANTSSTKRIPDFTSNDIYCGLCTSELDCVCRQVGLKPPLQTINLPQRNTSGNALAVPICRRPRPSSTTSIWRVVTDAETTSPASPETESVLTRECNGNPKDCPACRDDPFGQAFCTALNQAKASQEPESSTKLTTSTSTTITTSSGSGSSSSSSSNRVFNSQQSDPVVDAYMSIPCCGDPGLCGSKNCFDNAPSPTDVKNEMKVSCSEAWRQLKAHPNIGLANLQLLADVVARKSTPFSSSPHPIDSLHSSSIIDHSHRDQRHSSFLSDSIRPLSSHSTLENEDSSFSPHITLSTVFENSHGDFQDDHTEGISKSFLPPPPTTSFPSSDHSDLDRDHDSILSNFPTDHHHQSNLFIHQTNHTPFVKKQVKFVEKESLDQALRMLDRTGHHPPT